MVQRLASLSPSARRAFILSRAGLLLFAYCGLTVFPLAEMQHAWRAFPHFLWLDGWARWDSGWYLTIVTQGYEYHAAGQSNVAFFPLLPFAAWLLSLPLRAFLDVSQSFYLGGILVSHLAFAAAIIGLHRLGTRRYGARAADRAVWLVCLFPFSFFFNAVYSESLYLALGVWAFDEAERGRWSRASLCAALCALARLPGILLVPALFLEYLRQRQFRLARLDRSALHLLVAPLGLCALIGYHALRFGDPFVFLSTQMHWGRHFGNLHLWRALRFVCIGPAHGGNVHDRVLIGSYLVVLFCFIALLARHARRLGPGMTFFGVASLLVAVSSGLLSFGRFASVIFPAFLAAGASLRSRVAFVAVCCLFVPLLCQFTFDFTHWFHVY